MDMCGVIVIEEAGAPAARRGQPKVPAMERVANRPIALHVLDALQNVGIADVVVVSSPRAAHVVREGLAGCEGREWARLRFVQGHAPIDLGGTLGLVAPLVGDRPCLMHVGGGMLAEPLEALAMAVNGGAELVVAVHQATVPDQRLTAEAQGLLGLAELDSTRPALGVAAIWGFGSASLQRTVAGPMPKGLQLAGLVRLVHDAGGTIHVRASEAWHAYRGDPADLLELNRIVLDRIETDLPPGSREANRIQGPVRIHPTATVRDSVLTGPVVIGAGATVTDSYVGPSTAVGDRARIEGSEVERSIVADEARLIHVGHRLADSVIGRNARVFRDFSLPQALRMRLGDGTEVGLC
jgi:glucose-1-phosphate thymidylyltransferase